MGGNRKMSAVVIGVSYKPGIGYSVAKRLAKEGLKVGRCKLDPILKATCFQTLNLRVPTVLST